jgi:thymidine phosphorylase
MRTHEQASELAAAMVGMAAECGLKARALLTGMDKPLGRAVGNWLEVKESMECLAGGGPADLRELVLACAANLLVLTGRCAEFDEAESRAAACLGSGEPMRLWRRMLSMQGADMAAFDRKLAQDSTAACVREALAESAGYVAGCDARLVGELVRDLGGGRATRESALNYEAGVDALTQRGEQVEPGQLLGRIHAATREAAEQGVRRLSAAFRITPEPPEPQPLIVSVVG